MDEQAEASYRRVSDLQPEMPEGWMGICRLRLLQGDANGARNLWLENGRRYNNFELARQMGAQVELFTGQYREAMDHYQALASTASDGGGQFYGAVSYKSALGTLLVLTGRIDEGRALLNERLATLLSQLEAAPRNSEMLYEAAAIESSLGSKQRALKYLERATACGWTDYRSTLVDPRFENIRNENEFRTAIDAIRQKVAALREGAKNWSGSESHDSQDLQ